MIMTIVGASAYIAAAMGFAVRATLLSGRANGWPCAPWPVKLALWVVAGACTAEGLVLWWRDEHVTQELVVLGLAIAAYSFVAAVNLALQRDQSHCAEARARILALIPAVARRGEPPSWPRV